MQGGSLNERDSARYVSSLRTLQIYVRSTEVGHLHRDLEFFYFFRGGLIGRVDAGTVGPKFGEVCIGLGVRRASGLCHFLRFWG